MAALLILSGMSIGAFAIENGANDYGGIDISKYTNSELDLSQYTMSDILNMSAEEYMNLVSEFERVYDPYDSYVEPNNESDNSLVEPAGNGAVSPQWTSGSFKDDEYAEEGSHEYISAIACGILINDKGFYSDNTTANVVIGLLISVASLLPDKDEREPLFAGHFYDPDTGKNYAYNDENTAKTNAVKHYYSAVEAAADGEMDKAYEYIGRCLHYVQDANEPHHAANVYVAQIPYGLSHSIFESFAFENQETYLDGYNTIPSSNYNNAASWSVGTITHNGAAEAKPMIKYVRNSLDKSDWPEYARRSMRNAARYSVMVLYKFGNEETS